MDDPQTAVLCHPHTAPGAAGIVGYIGNHRFRMGYHPIVSLADGVPGRHTFRSVGQQGFVGVERGKFLLLSGYIHRHDSEAEWVTGLQPGDILNASLIPDEILKRGESRLPSLVLRAVLAILHTL